MPAFEEFEARDLSGLKIGWMGSYEGYLNTEPGVLELCEASLGRLTREGAIVESCRPQYDMDRLWQTWLTLRHWTCHGTRALYDDPESRRLLKPEAVWEIEGSFDTSAADIYEAGIARADWFRALGALFDEYDFLVLPTAQVFPFSKELHWPQSINGVQMDTYHRWMEVVIGGTLAGLPWSTCRLVSISRAAPCVCRSWGVLGRTKQFWNFPWLTNWLQIIWTDDPTSSTASKPPLPGQGPASD